MLLGSAPMKNLRFPFLGRTLSWHRHCICHHGIPTNRQFGSVSPAYCRVLIVTYLLYGLLFSINKSVCVEIYNNKKHFRLPFLFLWICSVYIVQLHCPAYSEERKKNGKFLQKLFEKVLKMYGKHVEKEICKILCKSLLKNYLEKMFKKLGEKNVEKWLEILVDKLF